MRTWYESHSSDGPAINVIEAPWWAVAWSRFIEAVDYRHVLCGSNTPEWCWNLPMGKAKYEVDEDGSRFLTNSFASVLFRIFNAGVGADHTHSTSSYLVPVSPELAEQMFVHQFNDDLGD